MVKKIDISFTPLSAKELFDAKIKGRGKMSVSTIPLISTENQSGSTINPPVVPNLRPSDVVKSFGKPLIPEAVIPKTSVDAVSEKALAAKEIVIPTENVEEEEAIEGYTEIVATASVTRQRAISIIMEKIPGSDQYFYQGESFVFGSQDLNVVNPLVNMHEMVEVLSTIDDANLPVDSLAICIIGNSIIERIRANQQINPVLSNYLTVLLSKEFWMGLASDSEDVPPVLVPAINLTEIVQNKLLSGGDILAIESQVSLRDWNTDLLFTALSSLHNRIAGSCGNIDTAVEELNQFANELTKRQREVTSLDPASITLLQNIKYLFQGHK